jgi:hypothetical protein
VNSRRFLLFFIRQFSVQCNCRFLSWSHFRGALHLSPVPGSDATQCAFPPRPYEILSPS